MTNARGAPASDEYNEFYSGYVGLVPDGPVLETLDRQGAKTFGLLSTISEERGGYRYADGKWSIKEVVGHLADIERVFSYRAMRFARGDTTPLPGMEQNDFVAAANFDGRSLASLAEELAAARRASLLLFTSFSDEELLRRGVASGFEVSVRALVYMTAGHELHHFRVLQERYL